jgi:cell division protein FtsQ
MSGITVHVEDRWQPTTRAPAKKAVRQQAPEKPQKVVAKRKPIRWPGPLRSRLLRRTLGFGALALLLLIAAVLFPTQKLVHTLQHISGEAGFRVADIFVDGRNKTPRDQLLKALGASRGDAIFAIDLDAARKRIEEIPWVRTASVERRLPDKLEILITERQPIALWQNKGRYFLVDREGQVVGDQIEDYPDLPLIVGEGAPDHAGQILTLLETQPDLKARVKAATWVSDRRWNLTFDKTPDGVEVRLPEEGAEEALQDLAAAEQSHKLLERQVAVVDLRMPDRLVLRATPAPPPKTQKIAGGKDF